MQIKVCKSCGKELPISNFTKAKKLKDGYENKCKECRQKQRKKVHKHTCKRCGKKFTSAKPNSKYCSRECQDLSHRNRVKIKCAYCGKEIEVIKSKHDKFNFLYCNQECRSEHLKILMKGENNPNYNKVDYICDGCGKLIKTDLYKIRTQKYIFCSNECYISNIGKYVSGTDNPQYNHQEYTCEQCGKKFKRIPSANRGNSIFCSRECYEEYKKVDSKEYIDIKCEICGEVFTITLADYNNRMKYNKRIYCSSKCACKGQSIHYSKENHPSWNPDISKEEREKNRHFDEYIKWRKGVFEKDNYTCQCCRDNKGGNLNAHHLNSYNWDKEHRLDINNGITLCDKCHKSFHATYGYGNNTKEQYINFSNEVIDRDVT